MGDVIIKPIFGSMGHGMVRVSDPDVAFRVVRSLEQMRIVFYVQRAVDHGGRDVRVFVVGGRVLGAIERRAPDGQWRTNVSLGGSARPFELPPAWEQLALRRGGGGRRRLRGRGPAAVARRHGVRARSERHSGMAGAAAGDRRRRRRSHRGSPGGSRSRGKRAGRPRGRGCRHDQGRRGPRAGCRAPRARRGGRRQRGAARLPARGERAEAGQRLARAATSPTRVTKTSSPVRSRLARRWPAPARARLGATVRLAVEATARWTRSNTNLGIVLLLAPLARAALTDRR